VAIEFTVSEFFSVPPEIIYKAWLNSEEHSNMTGSPARVSDKPGEDFEAWNGYIQGKNIILDAPRRILQTWRSTEFSDSDEDSLLDILFEMQKNGTLVTIHHSKLPDHGMQYQQGWRDAYFSPMKMYFKGVGPPEPLEDKRL
jgi:activator of HSP90 ATPase